jgi:phosphoenolpyruvate synthase/pyruvate phosphate dikinase
MGRVGEPVILLREETKPEDIHGFFAAQGILTSHQPPAAAGRLRMRQ